MLLVGLVGLLLGACAWQGSEPRVLVTDSWTRPAGRGENGAVYFVLENPGSRPDVLVGARGEVAQSVEIHRSVMGEGDVMRMEPQKSVEVPPGGRVAFEPGGLHVMLVDLNRELEAGEAFSIVLAFEQAGELGVEVEVRAP